jgi:hypothetical protein
MMNALAKLVSIGGPALSEPLVAVGNYQIRESLFVGPNGYIKFESTWQVLEGGLRVTTAIPFGGS